MTDEKKPETDDQREFVRQGMKALGWDKVILAEKSGVSLSTINRFLWGRTKKLQSRNLEDILNALAGKPTTQDRIRGLNMTDGPEIVGGPMAHMLADMVQRMQKESGSPDIDIVEVDRDGNEISRVRMKNAKLLKVEVSDPPLNDDEEIVVSAAQLVYDKPVVTAQRKAPVTLDLSQEVEDGIAHAKELEEAAREEDQASLNAAAIDLDKKIMGDGLVESVEVKKTDARKCVNCGDPVVHLLQQCKKDPKKYCSTGPDYKLKIAADCPTCGEAIQTLVEIEEVGSLMAKRAAAGKTAFAHPVGYAKPCGHHFMRDVFDVLKAQLTREP